MAGQATPLNRRQATSAEMAAVVSLSAFTSARRLAQGSGDAGQAGGMCIAGSGITVV